MATLARTPTLLRALVLSWLVAWVLTAPLFHIHSLDAQEDRFLSGAFLAHTVFSPDLPGEYALQTGVHQSGMPEHQHALSIHFLRYSEIGIGLFNKDDSKRKTGIQSVFSVQFFWLTRPPSNSVRNAIFQPASPPVRLLTASSFPRAPPSVSC